MIEIAICVATIFTVPSKVTKHFLQKNIFTMDSFCAENKDKISCECVETEMANGNFTNTSGDVTNENDVSGKCFIYFESCCLVG